MTVASTGSCALAAKDVRRGGLCLPGDYRRGEPVSRQAVERYWTQDRVTASIGYQWPVYAWAARTIQRRRLRSALDVGCGIGLKLQQLILPVCEDIEGVDSQQAIDAARRSGLPIQLSAVDLESPQPPAWRKFDFVICADVLEHLADPAATSRWLQGFCHPQSLILLSTPDRDRLRGRECRQSVKSDHVQEWSAREFRRFLRSQGLRPLRWRLFPQTRTPTWKGILPDALFRLGLKAQSPWACHAVLCTVR